MHFRRGLAPLLLLLLALGAGLTPAAQAAVPPLPGGARVLGMGGALRGAATGDAALALNPSGMSLVRSYVAESVYAFDRILGGNAHNFHGSVVDSTSGFNIGGGVYYTYLTDNGGPGQSRSGHEWGVALSIPFGDKFMIGFAGKYLRLRTADPVPEGVRRLTSGITLDVGATLRPIPALTFGVAGQNLLDKDSDRAPRTFGGGVTVAPVVDMIVAADAIMQTSPLDPARRPRVWHFMGGVEYLVGKSLGLRAGGGRKGDTEAYYVSGGLSFISAVGALDFGLQRDVSSQPRETVFAMSARLFVPAPAP